MFWSWRKVKREVLLEEPFPSEWLQYLQANVLLYRRLAEADQAKLHDRMRIFIAEKYWEGCAGLSITDEMRVTVAAQACLLALGWEDYHFEGLHTVLLYPGSFLAPARYEESEEVDWHLGEAHHRGPVILSWWHARWEARRLGRSNLVLHEFAHKLAELGDPHEGIPPVATQDLMERWHEIAGTEYDRLVEAAEYGRPTLLDPYGATNRAEFFAVATECFFLQPAALSARHPELYRLLADVFRQEPAAWKPLSPTEVAQEEAARREYVRQAIAECDAAIRLRPDWADAYRRRADCYWNQGEYDRAAADYGEVIRLTEGDEQAEAYCDRGYTYRDAGRYEQALADFDRALQLLPTYAEAYRQRGLTFREQGDLERTQADLTRALRLDPDDDAAHIERGRVYSLKKEYPKALRDFSKALQLCPWNLDALLARAEVYLRMEEYARVIADCDEALRLEPECAEAHQLRATAYTALGDEGRAEVPV